MEATDVGGTPNSPSRRGKAKAKAGSKRETPGPVRSSPRLRAKTKRRLQGGKESTSPSPKSRRKRDKAQKAEVEEEADCQEKTELELNSVAEEAEEKTQTVVEDVAKEAGKQRKTKLHGTNQMITTKSIADDIKEDRDTVSDTKDHTEDSPGDNKQEGQIGGGNFDNDDDDAPPEEVKCDFSKMNQAFEGWNLLGLIFNSSNGL